MISKLHKSNTQTIYIYICASVLANFIPLSIFSQVPQPRVECFFLFTFLIFGSFEAEGWLIDAVAHIYSIDNEMKHFSSWLAGHASVWIYLSCPLRDWKACSEPCLVPCRGGMVHLCLLSSVGHNILRVRRVPSLPRTPGFQCSPAETQEALSTQRS